MTLIAVLFADSLMQDNPAAGFNTVIIGLPVNLRSPVRAAAESRIAIRDKLVELPVFRDHQGAGGRWGTG